MGSPKVNQDDQEEVTAHVDDAAPQHSSLRDPRAWRDAVVFTIGLLGVIHEVFFTDLDRPALLVLFAGMIGLAGLGRSNPQ